MGNPENRSENSTVQHIWGKQVTGKKVAVLVGGFSAEREVSLESGRGVVKALKECGYEILPIDVRRDISAFIEKLDDSVDVVFNSLHGRYGEDGCIQGILDIIGIPYTHSGLLASALAMDKPMSKEIFAQHGIPVAKSIVTTRDKILSDEPMARPYVIKPLNEGSSVGVRIITSDDKEKPFDNEAWEYSETVMVEKYISGRELTVAVLNGKALGILEIKPNTGFYDYTAKYTDGKAVHVVPTDLPEDIYNKVIEYAEKAHKALGCKGLTRADFRYDDEKSEVYILEINTQPGMTPLSLAPEIASNAGITFNQLIKIIVENASCEM